MQKNASGKELSLLGKKFKQEMTPEDCTPYMM
jgi:hypothetical protein